MLFDGGAGTTLQDELGCKLGSARLWASELLLTGPGTLATLHRAWEAAGSQVVSTFRYRVYLIV
jgi:S-methylmethionine-dependent homocysteine/selenocysteine methylase